LKKRSKKLSFIVGVETTGVAMQLIDGKALAATLLENIKGETDTLPFTPGLAVVLVGDNPASKVYVANKIRTTEAAGMRSVEHRLPATTPQAELIALVAALNADPAIHGILVQLPLPAPLDADAVIAAIDPDKDVDGLTVTNAGRLAAGLPGLVPCTPLGAMLLLEHTLGSLEGRNALVIGRSALVGKPIAQLLLRADCTVTIAHSRTQNLPDICRRADIVIAAIGRPEFIRGDWVAPGATIIDVGINRIPNGEKTRLVGDVAFAECGHAAHITPVPGGVGPMTIACL
jgi:methylenetetrahydrofolate dehydrogenase (NADP+)/methenyltetrahydrofolate cyclohydrolase